MTLDEWLAYGQEQKWCSKPVCATHEGAPTTSAEDDEYDAGDDPCIYVIRIYESTTIVDAVDQNKHLSHE